MMLQRDDDHAHRFAGLQRVHPPQADRRAPRVVLTEGEVTQLRKERLTREAIGTGRFRAREDSGMAPLVIIVAILTAMVLLMG